MRTPNMKRTTFCEMEMENSEKILNWIPDMDLRMGAQR